ncbi:SGNH/GDSL hydrolase family protein [Paenibacillus aurantius]|uniref:SGNH/GDSL hydrolase family protein n=1 Tax=Paenibacillus aurantius TaxID=2918900 RepID=A0AA96RH58_9BACL|nr:SGNH/GDSL hydrolase family protein [Paenibacillus aurantius]WNQ13211.1 SGNH/GDSL hydrolase family protein [Paenibacillus aurantius]
MIKKNQVVLFQGDSITDGNRGRSQDLNHILGHGYVFLLASRLGCELAEETPLFVNRGISGNRVSDLYARWNEDAISLKPDLLSILIGVNDAARILRGEPGGATDRFERAYRVLLEETKEVLPHTSLVLCEPFLVKTDATVDCWEEWRSLMASYQQTVRELADRFGALFVPFQETFDEACGRAPAEYWVWDGVHPTAAGHHLMAEQWLSVVRGQGWI